MSWDVNGDGRRHLVLRFRARDGGLRCGETSASLTGRTLLGEALTGTDSVSIVRCRRT